MRNHGLRAVCVVAGVFLALAATSPGPQDTERMAEVVASYAASRQFMGAVLVARGETPILSRAYGMANLEWEVPATPATKFRIGSLTKQFTAAAILLLEQQGKLSVDDLVRTHLPDAPGAWDTITIRHLLTHTSGIPSFTSFPEYQRTQAQPVTIEQLVASFRDKPLEFAPGESFTYSNSGYVLLGYLLERIGGRPYADFLQEHIFSPLGMKDSGYDSHAVLTLRRASGYQQGPDGLVNARYIDMSIPHAAGALYSTTEDLLRWNLALFGGNVLSDASLKKMLTPARNDYAFGMTVTEQNGRTRYAHGGGIDGFNSFLAYYPDSRISVAVLSNVNGPAADAIGARLAAVAHGEAVQLPSERRQTSVSPKLLGEYVGIYELVPGTTITVRLEGEQLTGQVTGQQRFPMFAESDARFFFKVVDAQVDFVRDEKGAVSHLVLRQGGRDTTAARTSATVPPDRVGIAVPPHVLGRYVGTYELRPGFDLTVSLENGSLMGQATGQDKFPLSAESSTRFFFERAAIVVEFVSSAAGGDVTHMLFQQGPTTISAPRK